MSNTQTADRTLADLTAEAEELLAGLVAEPWGQVSTSVYETGRLVALSPALAGHDQRIDYLIRTQRPDGAWGCPESGYALVPTLSATDALLAAQRSDATTGHVAAAANGLRMLFQWLHGPGALTRSDLPDLPAIELIVPALVGAINRRLDEVGGQRPPGVRWWPGGERLRLPTGVDLGKLTTVRGRLAAGGDLPQKLLHALEVAGDIARRHPTIRPETTGTVGASPAATAIWLGDPDATSPDCRSRVFLEKAVRRYAGPVPCGLPITVFERGWVLSWLMRAGIGLSPPAELVTSLASSLGPAGTAAAAGLPTDADTTAGALYALALTGRPQPPEPLWTYETDTGFCTWPGEDGISVSTNAHVLEAFGEYERTAATDEGDSARRAASIGKVAAWLRGRQSGDGSWHDRWHASPYYATVCVALALHRYGGPASATAVDRAVRWVLATQRADGSWGHWTGTVEETAYAVQLLLLTVDEIPDATYRQAVERGCEHLAFFATRPDDLPMWHDKDLYHPRAIVRAATIAALYLGRRHLGGVRGHHPQRAPLRRCQYRA